MLHTQAAPKATTSLPAWLLLVGVVLSLGIFTATYFAYFSRLEAHVGGSYLPLGVGLAAFFLVIYAIAFKGIAAATFLGRSVKAACCALLGSAGFVILLLFLVLNTLGA